MLMFKVNISNCFLNKWYFHLVLYSMLANVIWSYILFLISRWATQGFDFLQAIEAAFISALPEDDFLVRYPCPAVLISVLDIEFSFCFAVESWIINIMSYRVCKLWWMNVLGMLSANRTVQSAVCTLVSALFSCPAVFVIYTVFVSLCCHCM